MLPLNQVLEYIPRSTEDAELGWVVDWLLFGETQTGDTIAIDPASKDPAKHGRVLQFNHEYSGALPVASSLRVYFQEIADGLDSGAIRFDKYFGLSREHGVDFDEAYGDGKLEAAPIDD